MLSLFDILGYSICHVMFLGVKATANLFDFFGQSPNKIFQAGPKGYGIFSVCSFW